MNYKKLFFLLSAFFATCFANLYATDYYWVGANGGSNGTWSELTSWKLKNGLPPPFLPTNNDNVYFDVNSFGATAPSRTVTINASVSCDSLIFVTSGANAIPFGTNPILALNGTIYASGSVQLKAGMTTSGNGTLILNSTGTTETLDLAEVTFNPGLTIEDGAKWTVTGNLTLNNASVASIFTYKNHNSLTINGNLKAGVLIWGDGTAATRDSLTVNGDLLLFYSQSAGTNSRFDYGGTLKVTGNMDTGMYFYFTYSENMNIGGNYRSDYYFYFQNNTGGINIGGSFNTYRDYNHTNSGGGLTVGTSFTVGTYQSSFNFTGNTGDVVIGTTMTTGEFTFSSTAPGVGNLTIGESYTLNTGNYLDFKFNSPGDITVGSAATIGNPVFTVMSSKLTNAPRYQSIRIHGNGTKTFYGNVSSAYGAKFIDGTVDIKGNLNLGNYTAAYFSDYQSPSLIFGNCKLRVRGDVTGAGYLITGGYNMTGGETHPTTWDVYPETEVTVDGNFTLANLEIRGGITNIGGTLTLTPYNPNDSITRRSLSVLGGTLNFPNAPAVPATINCASDFRVTGNNAISNTRTGGILTSTSTTAANYTYTGGTTVPGGVTNGNVTGLGNALINVDYNYIFTSPGATVLDTTTATVTSPRLVRIKYGSFTARAGDAYRDLEFTDHNGYSIHNVNMGSFNRIEVFQGPASFSYAANISADSLLIHPRETQWFSRTTNVNKHLRIRPDDCGGVIPVNNGIIAMGASSSVDASTLQLKNNHITGPGMDYPVARSIDDGGNSGWDIQAFSGQNLYWVGGAGNWDDPRHWSLISATDGSRTFPGNGCIPTRFDNVFFDDASGLLLNTDTVKLTSTAYCDSMTWTGLGAYSPVIKYTHTNQYPINIYGSLSVTGSDNVKFDGGDIRFVSERPAETVRTGTVKLIGDVYFNGTGLMTLLDSLDVSSHIYFGGDSLNLNTQKVKARYFVTSGSEGLLNIASSTIELEHGWSYTRTTAAVSTDVLVAGNSLIKIKKTTAGGENSTLYSGFNTASDYDTYHNLEFTTGVHTGESNLYNRTEISKGSFNKITLYGGSTILVGGTFYDYYTHLQFYQTDSLVLLQDLGATYHVAGNLIIHEYLGNSNDCGLISNLYGFAANNATTAANWSIDYRGLSAGVALRNLNIDRVNIAGANTPYVIADGSVGATNTSGWSVNTVKRTWYWIGDGGLWSDINHWSSRSGGFGMDAENPCQPPKNPDNVVFDDNSFTLNNQIVMVDINASCDTMIWTGSSFETRKPSFRLNGTSTQKRTLNIYGSLTLQKGVIITNNGDGGTGIGTPSESGNYDGSTGSYNDFLLSSTRPNETLKTNGAVMALMALRFNTPNTTWDIPDGLASRSCVLFGTSAINNATAVWNIGGDINLSASYGNAWRHAIYHYFGTLNTAGQTVNIIDFDGNSGSAQKDLNIKNSTWNVAGNYNYNGRITFAQSEGSQINMSGIKNTFTATAAQYYNKVTFTNTDLGASTATNNNTVTLGNYKYLRFNANATIDRIVTDTLHFGNTNGYTYQFATGAMGTYVSKINNAWYGSGIRCAIINIKSTANGVPAYVSVGKAAATIKEDPTDGRDTLYLDFIQVRDIYALTTAQAGADGERAVLEKGNQSSKTAPFGQPDNVNWVLDNYAGVDGFLGLGPDVTLSCSRYPYNILTTYFAGSPDTEYEWRKAGSPAIIGTDSYFPINDETEAGTYVVDVKYLPTCQVYDTIVITALPGKDTLIWVGDETTNINYYNTANWTHTDGSAVTPQVLRAKESCLVIHRYWWYLSSPFTTFNSGTFVADTTLNKFGFYNEALGDYTTPPVTGASTYDNSYRGRGFAALLYANPQKRYFADSGSFTENSGDIAVSVSRTNNAGNISRNFDGFNLLGNPYPVAISATAFLTDLENNPDPQNINGVSVPNKQGPIYQHLWYRSHIGGDKSLLDWEYFCIDIDSLGNPYPESLINLSSRPDDSLDSIASMQAFWVRVRKTHLQGMPGKSGTYSIKFKESMKLGTSTGILRVRRQTPQMPADRQAVRLKVSGGKYSDQTLLIFKPNGTLNASNDVDMEKQANDHPFIPQIYSRKANSKWAINKLPSITAGMQIPVGFNTGEEGIFTVSSSGLDNIPYNIDVILRDNHTGVDYNLSGGEVCTFYSDEVDTYSRFTLTFRANGNITDSNNATTSNLLVYADDASHITVLGAQGKEVSVYDAVGKLISRNLAASDHYVSPQTLTSGVYVVKIGNNVNKVIIK